MLNEGVINGKIKEQVYEVFNEYNVLIPGDKYERILDKQLTKGKKIWENEFRILLKDLNFNDLSKSTGGNSPLYYLKNAPRLSAFGYTFGSQMHKALKGNKKTAEQVALTNTLFNVSIPLFDQICDNYADLYPGLVKRITKDTLLDALSITSNGHPCFSSKPGDELIIKVIAKLAEEYFANCRKLFKVGRNSIVWQEYVRTILTLYESELQSTRLNYFLAKESGYIYNILRNKSSLPIWTMCLVSLLTDNSTGEGELQELKKCMLKLGDIFWIMDDIVDAQDDLIENKWSFVWYRFVFDGNLKILDEHKNKKSPKIILNELIESGTIKNAARELCQNYIFLTGLAEGTLKKNPELKMTILVWLRNWIEAL